MIFAYFAHSVSSDWSNDAAHFQRGVLRELVRAGHEVRAFEPEDGWSRISLVQDQGLEAVARCARQFPELSPIAYRLDRLDLDQALDGVDVAVVHGWSPPELTARIGRKRLLGGRFKLLFHDTGHRFVSDPQALGDELEGFDGVLAGGAALRESHLARGLAGRVWIWHEAADTRLFRPLDCQERWGDLIWIGNWGDDERRGELQEFLLDPVKALRLRAQVRGARLPPEAVEAIAAAGARCGGWVAGHDLPQLFARFALTVHVPDRQRRLALPGVPAIRVFEALACGIPLICGPWEDTERLFRAEDYLVANDGPAMRRIMRDLLSDRHLAARLAKNGLETIAARHTCRHRAQELLAVCAALDLPTRSAA